MAHSCPDGTHTKLVRTGPIGTTEGVTFTCPRCGWSQSAGQMEREFEELRPMIVAALSPRRR